MQTDATVCEIDAHFRHNYLKHKTMRRHQKYNLKLLKFAIDAQKSEDCRFRILTIKNGSNPVFEPNILAGVEGLEPSRTVLENLQAIWSFRAIPTSPDTSLEPSPTFRRLGCKKQNQ